MDDLRGISRQRWSALWNGVLIGIGIQFLLLVGPQGLFFGLLMVGVGAGLEYWQRQRLKRQG